MVDNSGIKGIEEQDLPSTRKSRRDARSMMSPQEKEMRRTQTVDKLKKDFKQVLPYVGQIGLDFKMGSGIAEFFGQQPDIVEGGKRPSYFEAAQRTSDLISEGKVTDAIVSGVDQTLTAVGGIGEGVMAAGVMLGPAGLPLLAGGWVANQISKRGKAILTNTKTGQRVLANFSGDTEKGFNIESIDVPKGREENQIIDTLGEVVDKDIVPVNKVDLTDADFESVPTPEQKIGQGTLKEAGFNPSQATAFWVQSGYSKAFPDLTRNEVANVLLDNPEVMKQSQDAISKMYTPTIKDGKEFFSVFRRVPLKGKEGLETDEVIISGTLDPRVLPRYSMSSTMDQPESIIRDDKSLGTKLSEMGMPMSMKKGYDPGKEIIIRYDVPKEKIIGYVPELVKASNTRGAKAKIEKTYDVKLDTDKNKLGFYKSLEKNAASEQEVFADVRGIQPTIIKDYEGGIEAIRNNQATNIVLKSDKKTGAEILEDEGGIGRYSVLDDKFIKGAPDDPRAILKGYKAGSKGEEKYGLIPNPKYGKGAKEINENFEKANIEELDKRLDFVKQEFNLNQLEKPDEGIKAIEQKDLDRKAKIEQRRKEANIARFGYDPKDPKDIKKEVEKKPRDESSGHAADYVPAQYGPPAHDMNMVIKEEFAPEGYSTMSADIGENYENLKYFITSRRGTKEYDEEVAFFRKLFEIKGNPDAEVTIYRASPTDDLRAGDLVTPIKSDAEDLVEESKITRKDIRDAERKRRMEEGPIDLAKEKTFKKMDAIIDIFPEPKKTPSKLFTYKVKAKDLRWDGNNGLVRWGYFPEADVVPLKSEKVDKVDKKALGGLVDRNTYDWVYTDG